MAQNMLKFGNIEMDVPFFQAPLSGYTDRAMRVLARQFGAPLTFTGVLLDKVSLHPRAIRKLLSNPGPDESPVGAQILGTTPETMAQSAVCFEKYGFDLIDLNFACPAPKVLRRGRGGALLKKPDVAIEIFKQVRDAVKCPVTVKLRTCFEHEDGTIDNFWKICEGLVANGVDGIVIHGRSVKQLYRNKAEWETVVKVKHQFPNTPIVGSGDIMTAEDALQRYKETGLDGILIARGAIGNPWIFREARELFNDNPKPAPPSLQEMGQTMIKHLEMLLETKDELKSVRFFRKFASGYCKRHPQRKKALLGLMACKNAEQVYKIIDEYFLGPIASN